MADTRPPFEVSATHSAPLPLGATFVTGTGQLFVTFNRRMRDDAALDTSNWFVRVGNVERDVQAAGSTGTLVVAVTTAGAGNVGADEVTYSPPPFDVQSDERVPVAGFSLIPTVL